MAQGCLAGPINALAFIALNQADQAHQNAHAGHAPHVEHRLSPAACLRANRFGPAQQPGRTLLDATALVRVNMIGMGLK